MIDQKDYQDITEDLIDISSKVTNDFIENYPAYVREVGHLSKTFVDLTHKMVQGNHDFGKVQEDCANFFVKQQELFQNIFTNTTSKEEVRPSNGDKRFRGEEWNEHPYFSFAKQNYLLISDLIKGIVDRVELDDKSKMKLDFYTNQFIDAMSPSNYLISNPEALKLASDTGGESLVQGLKNFLGDVKKGKITQTDESVFTIGENIAATEGKVIYRNDLVELIKYKPTTEKVHETPLLIFPPWINKYYILDLEQSNSFVKYVVDQGYTVFLVSWKNPGKAEGKFDFEDYVNLAGLSCIDVVKDITKKEKINVLGYCIGGTMLGAALSILKERNDQSINSVTFLTTMHDFSYVGPMEYTIDSMLVEKLKEELHDGTVMKGSDLELAFNVIRANDLVWNYVVSNYLKGQSPKAFSVLHWTNDNANLPAKMYMTYLEKMLYENKLREPNALAMCGSKIDLTKVDYPMYIFATKEDHIAPPQTVFESTDIFSGDLQFVLGESGHVMGVVNPADKVKYGTYLNGELGKGYDHWLLTAQRDDHSWWIHWTKWLEGKSGNLVKAPTTYGNKNYRAIMNAPGSYVTETPTI